MSELQCLWHIFAKNEIIARHDEDNKSGHHTSNDQEDCADLIYDTVLSPEGCTKFLHLILPL